MVMLGIERLTGSRGGRTCASDSMSTLFALQNKGRAFGERGSGSGGPL